MDYDFIHKQQDFKCCLCGEVFDFEIIDGKVHSNFTIDRLSKEKPHVKSNCKLSCCHCNVSKK